MSVNVNYCDTFLNALTNAYTAGDYVRTLGFAAVGDGGAAIYKVVSGVPSNVISCTVSGVSFNYADGKFYVSGGAIFQLVPQNGIVYAEQFGVFPGDGAFAADNIKMLNRAVAYAAKNACVLTFVSKGIYYLYPGSIDIPSGMHIDGKGATLQIYGTSSAVNLFNSSSIVDDVSIRNLNLIGRKTAAKSGSSDQAIHINCSNLMVQNVCFKFFEFALHTYGGKTVEKYGVISDGETKTYDIVDIPNRNWLIDSCKTESCVFGIATSEVDGLVIKDSDISCYTTSDDTAHCVYLSSNCSNVRVANTVLHNVSGDAIHKAYSDTAKLDSSKNHFFTDLSIHNVDSALDIGIISQNVMCDNIFATEVDVVLQLIGADNCIVSNSYFVGRSDDSSKKTKFIYAEDTCNCWMQNSYVKYNGNHRDASVYSPSAYIKNMYADKKHRRMYIGQDFDIPNHWLKFTGCEFSAAGKNLYYFLNAYDEEKTVYHEYWDNCILTYYASKDFFRFRCINTIPAGVTIRNSYLKYDTTDTDIGAPFRFQCGQGNCNCLTENTCVKKQLGKRMPFVHYENNVLDKFLENNPTYLWNYHINTYEENAHNFKIPDAVKISGSYVSNVYRLDNGKIAQMSNLDNSGLK